MRPSRAPVFYTDRERREADLFYAELMGHRSRPRRRRTFYEGEDTEAVGAPIVDPLLGPLFTVSASAVMTPTAAPTPLAPRPAAPPTDREDAAEIILGTDDRVRVVDTTASPYRFICCLDLAFPHPNVTGAFVRGRGSGTLISDRHILTAGHNLFHDAAGGTRRWASSVFAAPGRDGRTLPFGEAPASQRRVSAEWLSSPDPEFDFGLITLDNPIGSQTFGVLRGAALGFWGHPSLGGGTHLRALELDRLRGSAVNLSGYPIDKCLNQPASGSLTPTQAAACTGAVPGNSRLVDIGSTNWRAYGSVVDPAPAAQPRLLTHNLDSFEGHSGSPIWLRWQQYRNLVAVHTGRYGPLSTATANRGTRITDAVLTTLRGWMAADGVTASF